MVDRDLLDLGLADVEGQRPPQRPALPGRREAAFVADAADLQVAVLTGGHLVQIAGHAAGEASTRGSQGDPVEPWEAECSKRPRDSRQCREFTSRRRNINSLCSA